MNTETIEQHVQANSEDKPANVRDAVRQITLKTLSSIETVVDAARSSQGPDTVTLRDLAKHARRTSTAFGRLGNAALGQLNCIIVDLAKTQIKTGKHTLRTGGALLAGTASGMLAGIAERLQPASANKSDQSKPGSGD
jgi:hypothetical protein